MNNNIYFPVKEDQVIVNGVVAPNHKAIIRTDTNQVLGIHSLKYKLTTNDEVFGRLEEGLSRNFDLAAAHVHTQLDKNGARTLRTYMFPEHQVDVGGGDSVAFELRAANSYDASHTFGLMAGGFRFACFNGMVVGAALANVKKRHTASLDIDYVVASLNRAFETYEGNVQLWQRWVNTQITHEQASSIIKSVSTGPRMLETLTEQWHTESRSLGVTAWALYNALTSWSTHTQAKAAHGTALLIREDRVRKVLPQLERLAA